MLSAIYKYIMPKSLLYSRQVLDWALLVELLICTHSNKHVLMLTEIDGQACVVLCT